MEEERSWDLSRPDVLQKYRAAAKVTNDVLAFVVQTAAPGMPVWELCRAADEQITAGCAAVFQSLKNKGVAFPTCIARNNCAGHYSPLEEDSEVLAEGDVVKVDLGAHFDGLIATGAHTFVCTSTVDQPITGRAADVICAAYYGGEAALRLCRPGRKSSEVTGILASIAEVFNCSVVEGVMSHQMGRCELEGDKVIINKPRESDNPEEFEFEQGEVYSIDIVMSTGAGKNGVRNTFNTALQVRQKDARTTVYRRDPDSAYSLKLKASRALFQEIKRKYRFGAFTLRSFEDPKTAKLGIGEISKHELVYPYPVLYEADGELVAQFKFTVLILGGSTQKLTAHPPPFVQSEFSITDPKINQVLQMGLKRANNTKKKKKKKKAAADAAAASSTAGGDE